MGLAIIQIAKLLCPIQKVHVYNYNYFRFKYFLGRDYFYPASGSEVFSKSVYGPMTCH